MNIVMSVLARAMALASPQIIECLRNMAIEFSQKAESTPNPVDDILADIFKALVGAR